MEQIIQNVSDTAFWVAHYRAIETLRPYPLFKDPLAGVLAGDKGKQIAESMHSTHYTEFSVIMRTVIIDAYIQKLVSAGKIDCVLNLGAGLDTRPYRLSLPSDFPWIEVDFPGVIDFKSGKLQNETPKVKLERVKLDLTKADLREEFFNGVSARFKNVLVLTEGVVPYLSNEDTAALGNALRKQTHFKYWVLEYFSPRVIQYIKKLRTTQMKNAPFQFEPANWFEFFGRLGWQLDEMRFLNEEAKKRGRNPPVNFRMRLFKLFMPPAQRHKMDQLSGYALLKRGD